MTKTRQLTVKQLSSLIGLSESRLRTHLACFEKYRVPKAMPLAYFYNRSFIVDLRVFYIERSHSISSRYYQKYDKTIKRLDSLLNAMNNAYKQNRPQKQ